MLSIQTSKVQHWNDSRVNSCSRIVRIHWITKSANYSDIRAILIIKWGIQQVMIYLYTTYVWKNMEIQPLTRAHVRRTHIQQFIMHKLHKSIQFAWIILTVIYTIPHLFFTRYFIKFSYNVRITQGWSGFGLEKYCAKLFTWMVCRGFISSPTVWSSVC